MKKTKRNKIIYNINEIKFNNDEEKRQKKKASLNYE